MSVATNGHLARYTRGLVCPICGGSDDDDRGQGVRCFGYLSSDRLYAHCTREDHANGAELPYCARSQTWAHRLNGPCHCGIEHGPAIEPTRKVRGKFDVERAYDYLDADGRLLFQVARLRPKDFRQRRPDGKGGWTWNLKGVEPVLYRLPDLLAADPSAWVFIVEGEKDVDRLRTHGAVATTNPMGQGKWRDAYAGSLRGRRVAILPDNDQVGRDHAAAVARSLSGVAAEARVVELPGLPEKGDVSNYLDAGHSLSDLLTLVEAAPVWRPSPEANGHHRANGDGHVNGEARSRGVEPEPPINRTDLGNSRRLVRVAGRDLRFCYPWGKWLHWDGQRWREDLAGQVTQLAKRTVQTIAAEAGATDDDDERKALLKWALTSENRKQIDAMIALAQSEPGIPIEPGDLDRDRYLLNVESGTIDLKTGEHRPHRREDLLTKLAPVRFDPDARCPKFLDFLGQITQGDGDLIGFLQRAAGYAITGDIGEHCLFFLHGGGRNGKSTWLGVIQGILGGYATTINAAVLTSKLHDDHPTEICDLDGARFVTTIEVEDGKRMAEALVKSLTGGDRIKARRMRRDPYQFDPTFKLFVAANHKPEIRGTDDGIWSRIKLIPFSVVIAKERRVRNLADKLREEEGPGILNWLIEGCREWQRIGLKEPKVVTDATDGYRAEMDSISDFIAERCVTLPGVRCKANDLYAAYKGWCERSGVVHLSLRKFGAEMTTRGYKHRDSNGTRWRDGIGLAQEPESPCY